VKSRSHAQREQRQSLGFYENVPLAVRRLLGYMFFGLLVNCGASGSVASPRHTLSVLAQATQRANGADVVYGLLPARTRRTLSLEAFRARFQTDQREMARFGQGLSESLAQNRMVQAELTLADGTPVALVDHPDGWRVGDPGMGAPAATTLEGIAGARAALRFLNATLRRQGSMPWSAVLSSRALGDLRVDFASIAEATNNPEGLPYTTRGTRVMFRLPDARTLEVVREDGQWRVDALHEPEP
jgi:hypothetical protein